jgi:hypothetical protein
MDEPNRMSGIGVTPRFAFFSLERSCLSLLPLQHAANSVYGHVVQTSVHLHEGVPGLQRTTRKTFVLRCARDTRVMLTPMSRSPRLATSVQVE